MPILKVVNLTFLTSLVIKMNALRIFILKGEYMPFVMSYI